MNMQKWLRESGLLNETTDYKDLVSKDRRPHSMAVMCSSFSCNGNTHSRYGALKDKRLVKNDACPDCGCAVYYKVLPDETIDEIRLRQQTKREKK